MKKVTIYTDGACSGNPGPGGWGAILIAPPHNKEISGFCTLATNNIMELTAVIEALKRVKSESEIEIFTDSTYVRDGITKWILNWKKNNWRTANKKEVKNKDLWVELDLLSSKHKTTWHWVKAHNGDPFNERADFLAVSAIKK